MSLSYAEIVSGLDAYQAQLALLSGLNPTDSPDVPQNGNYAGNGSNDFWNKAQALEDVYGSEFGESPIDFETDRSPNALAYAETLINTISAIEILNPPPGGQNPDILNIILKDAADIAAEQHDEALGQATYNWNSPGGNTLASAKAEFLANLNFAASELGYVLSNSQNMSQSDIDYDLGAAVGLGLFGGAQLLVDAGALTLDALSSFINSTMTAIENAVAAAAGDLEAEVSAALNGINGALGVLGAALNQTANQSEQDLEAFGNGIIQMLANLFKPTGPLGAFPIGAELLSGLFGPHSPISAGYVKQIQNDFIRATRDPLVIDVAGTGLNLTGISSGSPSFDWGDGEALSPTGWMGAGTGLLALANGSGQITVQNLFGPGAPDGFSALRALDSNGDGVINASDSGFANLVVWQDLNGDGVAQSNEIQTLSQLGVVSISLNATADGESINGNDVVSYATITMSDGSTREIADVAFAQSAEYTPYSGGGTVSTAAAALPDLQGYGQLANLRVAMTQDATLLSDVQSFVAAGGADSTSLDAAVSQIMFEWAGVTNVDPSSRGSLFDARKLEFLEKFLGVPFEGLGGSNPFLTHQAETLNTAYTAAFDGIKARLLIQVPGSPLSQIFTFDASTDTVGLASNLGASLVAMGSLAPSDAASAIGYWADALTVFSEYSSDAGGMGSDATALVSAFRALAPSVFSSNVIQAAVNGTLEYIDASVEFASNPSDRIVSGGEGTDLVLITAPGVTFVNQAGNDDVVIGAGAGNVTINDGQAPSTSQNVLSFAQVGSLSDLSISGDAAGDVVITYDTAGDAVTIVNGLFNSGSLGSLVLDDGTTLTRAQVLALADIGTATNTMLYGSPGADLFDPKGYAHYAQGNGGADTFIYNSAYGALEISEDGGWQTPSSGMLQFGAGITPSQISVSADSSGDIFLTDGVSGDQIKLDGERNLSILGAPEWGVAGVTFADGTTWTRAQLIAQSLIASPTNQTLYGTGGADTFVYHSGDGAVEVAEYTGGSANSTAVLQLGSGITLADLTASFDSSGDEILTDGVTGDQIKLDGEAIINWSGGYFTSHGVSQLALSDGTTLNRQDLLNLATTGSAEHTTLYGTSNADTFDSKGYATYEQGNGGADAFIYNSGYGALEINEDGGWQTPSSAVLQFGAGIAPSQISVSADSSGDIFLTDGVTGDQIKLDGERNLSILGAAEYGVAQVTFADGTSWTRAQLIAQSLTASPTNQTLYGTGGADTFVYASGDGAVEVVEYTGGSANSTAVLRLGSGITLADLTASFDSSGDEILTDGVTGDQIKLDGEAIINWSGGYFTSHGVSQLALSDGTTLNRQDLLNLATTGSAGHTTLYGTSNADTFDSKGYATYEQGNGGSDAFVYNSGYGALEINEDAGWQTTSTAVLQFGAGIAPGDLSVTGDSSGDIFITDGVTGDQIKLDGQKNLTYMGVSETGVSQVTFADGTTWTRAQLIAQSLIASPTNQTLYGTGGADTFVYASGDGAVEVKEDTGGASNSTAILQLAAGLTLADLTASFDSSGDEILTDGVTGDQIKLDGEANVVWNGGYHTSQGVAQVNFADGTSIDRQQLLNIETTGGPGRTALYGSSGANVFDSRGYAHYAQGNGGADTFIYNSGYGALEINEDGGWQTPSSAVLQFGAGIAPSQISVSADSSGDIFLTDGVTGDQIKLDGERNLSILGAAEYGVAQVTFADGTSHETVRLWWNRFGPMFAAEIRRKRVQHMRSYTHWRWNLDEVYVKINGEMCYLWRAVDHEGEVLESYVTTTRDKAAALKFIKKAMKRHGNPQAIVTDRLRSYAAAMKEIGNAERQETGRRLNNRAENSHLPFRRRERAMNRFRRMKTLQKFVSVHASVHNHFSQERHLVSREIYRERRAAALAAWRSVLA